MDDVISSETESARLEGEPDPESPSPNSKKALAFFGTIVSPTIKNAGDNCDPYGDPDSPEPDFGDEYCTQPDSPKAKPDTPHCLSPIPEERLLLAFRSFRCSPEPDPPAPPPNSPEGKRHSTIDYVGKFRLNNTARGLDNLLLYATPCKNMSSEPNRVPKPSRPELPEGPAKAKFLAVFIPYATQVDGRNSPEPDPVPEPGRPDSPEGSAKLFTALGPFFTHRGHSPSPEPMPEPGRPDSPEGSAKATLPAVFFSSSAAFAQSRGSLALGSDPDDTDDEGDESNEYFSCRSAKATPLKFINHPAALIKHRGSLLLILNPDDNDDYSPPEEYLDPPSPEEYDGDDEDGTFESNDLTAKIGAAGQIILISIVVIHENKGSHKQGASFGQANLLSIRSSQDPDDYSADDYPSDDGYIYERSDSDD